MCKNEIIQFVDGDLHLDVTITPEKDTVWLTQEQMSDLFDTARSSIAYHINNIFKEGEVDKNTSVEIFDESNKAYRPPKYYNLDVIISVGYRVKSKRGIQFRKWANKVLKEYIISGYAINRKRLEVLNKTIEIQNNIITGFAEMVGVDAEEVLEVIKQYSLALNMIDDYDHQTVNKVQGHKTIAYLNKNDCDELIMKSSFFGKTNLFGKERPSCSLQGILDQIKQNVFGLELYPSVEEKAVNLLYMLVKDHIYFDGNKRIAAILFLEFLNRNRLLYKKDGNLILSNAALVAITLMIACSNPLEKDIIVNLVSNLLVRK